MNHRRLNLSDTQGFLAFIIRIMQARSAPTGHNYQGSSGEIIFWQSSARRMICQVSLSVI